MKTFRIITFGCRVNQAESRMMGEELVRNKFIKFNELLVNRQNPDIVVINTCCVTGKAEREVRKAIRSIKKENPDCFLLVAGCWAEKMLKEISGTRLARKQISTRFSKRRRINSNLSISSSAPANLRKHSRIYCLAREPNDTFSLIDLLVKNKEKKDIVKHIKKQFSNLTRKPFNHSFYKDKYFNDKKALIKIQEGCNKFCSYCIVPFVRGRSKSRSADRIIKEIRQKIKEGVEKVVLTGIDIASYKFEIRSTKFETILKELNSKFKNDLAKLIYLILEQTRIKKISFGSLAWEVFDKEFLHLTISNRLTSHFHIPLQSGCNETLKRMNRRYKIEDVRLKIKELKKIIPDFTFSTDIMVGFPGETKQKFGKTLKFIRELKGILEKNFIKAHIFRYSKRKGTLAEKLENVWKRVDEKEKKERAKIIRGVLDF